MALSMKKYKDYRIYWIIYCFLVQCLDHMIIFRFLKKETEELDVEYSISILICSIVLYFLK